MDNGDKVTWRVTSNVYSYDHVKELLSGYQDQISSLSNNISKTNEIIQEMNTKVDKYTEEIKDQIDIITNIKDNFDSKYLAKDVKIGKDNLNIDLYKGIKMNNINANFTITALNQKIDITNTCSIDDFVILYNTSSNKLLCRDIDYTITTEDTSVFLNILTANVAINNLLYLTGIRFNR